MKTADLRKKNAHDLGKQLLELETELREFRFGMSGGRTKNVKRALALRKGIARIKTILKQKSHS